MKDIMKIIKLLEESGWMIKRISQTIKNEAKEQKGEFLGMSLDTLGTILFGNPLTYNYISWRHCKSSSGFLMLPYHLTNFEIQNFYQNKPKFNGV